MLVLGSIHANLRSWDCKRKNKDKYFSKRLKVLPSKDTSSSPKDQNVRAAKGSSRCLRSNLTSC